MPQRKRILVLEDSPVFGSILNFVLRGLYEAEIATNGEIGWEMLQTGRYDLVITDCQMPKMDGLTVCKLLRSREEFRTLPIIMLTAKAFEFDTEATEEALQPCRVFIKPFDPKRLLATISQAFAGETAEEPTITRAAGSLQAMSHGLDTLLGSS